MFLLGFFIRVKLGFRLYGLKLFNIKVKDLSVGAR